MTEQLRLMAVHAHPDDESSKGGAAMAMYAAEGVEVMVVTCTGGERGSILNPKMADDREAAANLPKVRRREMASAAAILGVRHTWLGYLDSGMPEGDPLPPLPKDCFAVQPVEGAAASLVRAVREFRPHVMTTYDENGGYGHPDHIMCHKISVAAFDAAGDPDRYRNTGQPWQPLKLYYNRLFSRKRNRAISKAMIERGISPWYVEWLRDWQPQGEQHITTRVPCAEFFPRRDRALRAHATQVDPEGFWFQEPVELRQEVWPTEDFELVRSLVDTTIPEDDLFAGIQVGVTTPPPSVPERPWTMGPGGS